MREEIEHDDQEYDHDHPDADHRAEDLLMERVDGEGYRVAAKTQPARFRHRLAGGSEGDPRLALAEDSPVPAGVFGRCLQMCRRPCFGSTTKSRSTVSRGGEF